MANLAVRFVVQDIKDEGHDTRVLLRPAVATDNPNGTENASVWQGYPSVMDNKIQLKFKAGTANPFTSKTQQIVATFAAG